MLNIYVVFIVKKGSGKTYTMGTGNTGGLSEDETGIVQRAIKEMFQIVQVSR